MLSRSQSSGRFQSFSPALEVGVCGWKVNLSGSKTMPYNQIRDDLQFRVLYSSTFFSLRRLRVFQKALESCDYSVIASRRDAHVHLNDFLSAGVDGSDLFDFEKRFPGGLVDTFVCSAEGNISNWFSAMSSSLSHRPSNVAKDTEASGSNGASDRVVVMKDAAEQDNFKRFEELKKLMNAYRGTPLLLWHRQRFEDQISGSWSEPPEPRVPS